MLSIPTAMTTQDFFEWEKSFNYSMMKKQQKNQRIFFTLKSETFKFICTYFSQYFSANLSEKDWKLIYFYAFSTFQLKYNLHQKNMFRAGNFIFSFFSRPFSVVVLAGTS